MKDFLKKVLSRALIIKLRIIRRALRTTYHKNNLNKLAQIFGSDKWGKHFYTPHYAFHFREFRKKKINLLEIGAGGYENPHIGGSSLRMWKKFFPCAKIFSIDIYDKSPLQENRIRIFKGSQVDEAFLNRVVNEIGVIDIIVDDGSHMNEHVIESFKLLFPKLADHGIYVVEDLQTSYWEDFGGDSYDLNNPKTSMNFFKRLTDSLNYQEFRNPGYRQNYFDGKIVSMHFYHNMVFICKGDNLEKQYGKGRAELF